jgi:hypothetical protein
MNRRRADTAAAANRLILSRSLRLCNDLILHGFCERETTNHDMERIPAMDKVTEILLDAIREGMDGEGEHRLYRSGKLPGLFSARNSLNTEIATQALRDELLELVRTESKGKTTTEWVKVTQKGTAFLLNHESPLRAMEELKTALTVHQGGLPAWVAEMRQSLESLTQKFNEDISTLARRLDALATQVTESLRRGEQLAPRLPEGVAAALSWAPLAVGYLEKRQTSGLPEKCSLAELFAAVKDKEASLTVKDFHIGLRRLYDRGVLRLFPFDGADGPPEPEYALLDGAAMYYFAAR